MDKVVPINPRSSKIQVQSRVSDVQKLMLRGYTRFHIVETMAEQWNLSERQIDEYIARASEQIDEINRSSAERNLALISSNLWELYRHHMKKKEWGAARGLLLDIAKLRGLEKTEVNHTIRNHANASNEELAAALANHE